MLCKAFPNFSTEAVELNKLRPQVARFALDSGSSDMSKRLEGNLCADGETGAVGLFPLKTISSPLSEQLIVAGSEAFEGLRAKAASSS